MAGRGVNKVIIVGNLGNDPETRYTPSGSAITNISIATSESWKDKQTGQAQERTEWHKVVFFNRLAEIAGEYLRKGSKVYVEGSLRTRKWQDQAGVERYTTEIVANEMQMLDSKGSGTDVGAGSGAAGGYSSGGNANYGQAPATAPRQAPAPQQNPETAAPGKQDFDGFDDDIPF